MEIYSYAKTNTKTNETRFGQNLGLDNGVVIIRDLNYVLVIVELHIYSFSGGRRTMEQTGEE